ERRGHRSRDRIHPHHRARRHPPGRPGERGRDGTAQARGIFLMSSGLLRFITAGSVDDGKSTLIGRLLFDSKGLFADQVTAVEAASRKRGFTEIDLSLLTDGLLAERE